MDENTIVPEGEGKQKNQISLLFLSVYAMFSSSMSMTPIEEPNIDVKNSRDDLSNEIN